MARPRKFNEQEVLQKAVDLFWAKGYNGTSIQDLVNHLGINRASLYDTFGGKQSLYETALQQYKADSWKMTRKLIDSGLSAKEIVRNILDQAVADCQNDPLRKGCFVVNTAVELAPHDENIDKMIAANTQVFIETFAEVFRKGQANGEINKDKDPKALAGYLFNTFSGLRVLAKTKPDPAFLQDIIKTSLYVIEH